MAAWVIPAIAAAGQAAGGIGSIIGGLRSGRGGTDIGAQHYHNVMYQYEAPIYRMRGIMKAARESGIHPLAMLGQSYSSPSYSAFQGKGRDYAAIGRGIEGLSRGVAGIDRAIKKEQLEGLRLENAAKQLDVIKGHQELGGEQGVITDNLGIVQGGSSRIPGQLDALYQREPVVTSSSRGIQEGVAPAERLTVNERGYSDKVLSQPIQEAAESDMYYGAKRFIIKVISHGRNVAATTAGRQSFMKLVIRLEKERQNLPYLGTKHEWRYAVWRNQFRIVPRRGQNRLFMDPNLDWARRNIIYGRR